MVIKVAPTLGCSFLKPIMLQGEWLMLIGNLYKGRAIEVSQDTSVRGSAVEETSLVNHKEDHSLG